MTSWITFLASSQLEWRSREKQWPHWHKIAIISMVAYCCILGSLLATCLRCLDINAPNTLRISQISVWIYEKNPFRVNLTILQEKNTLLCLECRKYLLRRYQKTWLTFECKTIICELILLVMDGATWLTLITNCSKSMGIYIRFNLTHRQTYLQ